MVGILFGLCLAWVILDVLEKVFDAPRARAEQARIADEIRRARRVPRPPREPWLRFATAIALSFTILGVGVMLIFLLARLQDVHIN